MSRSISTEACTGRSDDYKSFSKKILVQRILAGADVQGEEIIGFGDGFVEIEEVKLVGGVAVGVASTEPECMAVDEWKRQRLIGVGADYIVPNYLCHAELLEALFPKPSKYEIFDRTRLEIKPLGERKNDLEISHWLGLEEATPAFRASSICTKSLRGFARRNRVDAARIVCMGAHVLRAGVNRHLIDLMERGFVSHLAVNGAAAIHDYELARIGATTESVARYVRSGEFGLWRETGELNDWIVEAARRDTGSERTSDAGSRRAIIRIATGACSRRRIDCRCR